MHILAIDFQKLNKEALELCWAIRELTESDQQTRCFIMASNLRNKIQELEERTK